MSRQNKNYANIYNSSVNFDKLYINTSTKVITVIIGDGKFELIDLYSQIKTIWLNDENMIKFPFPMTMITHDQILLTNNWNIVLKP